MQAFGLKQSVLEIPKVPETENYFFVCFVFKFITCIETAACQGGTPGVTTGVCPGWGRGRGPQQPPQTSL